MLAYQAVALLCVSLAVAQSIGGVVHHDADTAHFPFLVQITTPGRQMCCGTIINTRYILTAAGCERSWLPWSDVYIVVGIKSDYEKNYTIESWIAHPRIDKDVAIGLLRTTEEINYHSGHVEPVKLTSEDVDTYGYPVVIYGDIDTVFNGRDKKNGTWMHTTKLLDHEWCQVELTMDISNGWLCTWRYGYIKDEWNILHVGSPIMADGLQIGVTTDSGFSHQPLYHSYNITVSLRIYYYLDWIQMHAFNHQRSHGVTAHISSMFTCICLYFSWITK